MSASEGTILVKSTFSIATRMYTKETGEAGLPSAVGVLTNKGPGACAGAANSQAANARVFLACGAHHAHKLARLSAIPSD